MTVISRLGRYELRRILGKGAMGVVYEGYDPTLSRRVAVKTILKSVAHDDETERNYAERFVREAKAVARLNHPNIVQVFDFGVENEVAYLVMEFIQGRELRDFFIAGEAFEAGECIRIMGELLDALEFAHEAGVIHRDVKPANVMLDAQRRVKLADFGVARVQDSDRSAAGTMVGTPAFMSPEQISGGKVDRRSDLFSAGTILYQLLTGEQPFKGEGAWTVAKQIMQDDPPAPSSVVKSVSPAFDAIVDKALAKKVSDRYSSAREFATSLRGALSAPAGPTVSATAAQKPKAMPQASETELEFWRSIQNRDDLEELELFLEQFPEGAYAQLARLKLGKLRAPIEAARAAEEKARQESEEQARREAEAKAKREAEDKAQRQAQEHARLAAAEHARQEAEERARHEAEESARREAAERARRLAEEKARHETAEKAKREAEEKARQAAALARLKQQEETAARAKAARDEDATVSIGGARAGSSPTTERRPSYAVPVIAGAIVIAGVIGAYSILARKPSPPPVAEVPTQAPAPAPAVDTETIRRETEERLRKEFAGKAAAERSAMEKAVVEKLAAERAAAEKVTQAKTAAERASAEKAAAVASAARIAAEKAAVAKAADNASAEKANSERAAAERAAADKAAAERAATEKAAAEKAAATEKAAGEKTVAERLVAEKVAAEKALERFVQRHGKDKVLNSEPSISMNATSMSYPSGFVIYVNDSSCGPGAIKEITIENPGRNTYRSYRCIALADDKTLAIKPAAAKPAAAALVVAPIGIPDGDAQLERFIQRKGRDKVLKQETPDIAFNVPPGDLVYVNDGSCPPGKIKEIIGTPRTSTAGNQLRPARPSRCISLTD